MEKIDTLITNDELEKFRLNFPRCANREVSVAPFRTGLLTNTYI